MKDDHQEQQPYRPPDRRMNRYAAFGTCREEVTSRKDLFSLTINAAIQQGETMNNQSAAPNEPPFLIEFTFKPVEPGLRLRREETQLLLAYMGEILKEIEAEENLITEQAMAPQLEALSPEE